MALPFRQIAMLPFRPEGEEDEAAERRRGEEGEGERGEAITSSSSIPRLLLLPMPDYITRLQGWFNVQTFSDFVFVFQNPSGGKQERFHTHKVVLSRSLPMRNYLLQDLSRGSLEVPPEVSFSRLGRLLERFYFDGLLIRTADLALSPPELRFTEALFGPVDVHGDLPVRGLRQHLPSLLGARRFADGVWEGEETGRRVPVHRLLLSSRSEYFERAFHIGLEESRSGLVRVPGLREELAGLLLKFLYYSEESEWLNPDVVLEMLYVADRLQLGELKEVCLEEICRGFQNQGRGQVDKDNVLGILEASFQLHIPRLREACLSLALNNFFQVQEQEEFMSLSQELKTELKMLASLQNNPLGTKAICYAREMLAMLKESLQIQESRLEQVKGQYEAKLRAFEREEREGEEQPRPASPLAHLRNAPPQEPERVPLTEEVKQGRRLFLQHWQSLIEAQERSVTRMRNYLLDHQRIFEAM